MYSQAHKRHKNRIFCLMCLLYALWSSTKIRAQTKFQEKKDSHIWSCGKITVNFVATKIQTPCLYHSTKFHEWFSSLRAGKKQTPNFQQKLSNKNAWSNGTVCPQSHKMCPTLISSRAIRSRVKFITSLHDTAAAAEKMQIADNGLLLLQQQQQPLDS